MFFTKFSWHFWLLSQKQTMHVNQYYREQLQIQITPEDIASWTDSQLTQKRREIFKSCYDHFNTKKYVSGWWDEEVKEANALTATVGIQCLLNAQEEEHKSKVIECIRASNRQ